MTVLTGDLVGLADGLDRAFATIAARFGAVEYRFPPLIAARALARIDWFRSFPHLATFAVALDDGEDNLDAFASAAPSADASEVHLTKASPVTHVLSPAACYHLYDHHQGASFVAPAIFTLRGTCFRREAEFRPLERQWSFTMREIVIIGTGEECMAFLDAAQGEVDALRARLDLPAEWLHATDPFFRPLRNPQSLMQRLDPTKHELVFDGRLAIGSRNLHHDHFGHAYGITRAGHAAHSACVAFGIERWVAAVTSRHGSQPANWPEVA